MQMMKFKPNRKIKYTDEELQLLLHLRRKGGYVKPSKKTYNRKQKHKTKNFLKSSSLGLYSNWKCDILINVMSYYLSY